MLKCVYQWSWRKGNGFHFVEDQTVVTAAGPLSSNCYAPRHDFYTCPIFLIFLLLLPPHLLPCDDHSNIFFRFCNLPYSFSVYNVSTAVFVCFLRFSEVTAIVSLSSITITCYVIDLCDGDCECLLCGRE